MPIFEGAAVPVTTQEDETYPVNSYKKARGEGTACHTFGKYHRELNLAL
jgi:hypothetical protein